MTLVATIALALHGLLGPPDVVVAHTPGDDDPLELTWSAPDGCPEAAQVREHVRRRAGTTALRRTLARGRIERLDDGTWMLELVLEGDDGAFRRELRGTSCEALTAAAGLLIAVAADPTTQSGAPPDEAAPPLGSPFDEDITNPPVVASAAPPSRAPPTPRASDTRPPVETSMRTRSRGVDAALRVDIGGQFLRVLPAIADASFGGALAVRWPRASAELRGRYLPGQRSRYADRPSLGGVIGVGGVVGVVPYFVLVGGLLGWAIRRVGGWRAVALAAGVAAAVIGAYATVRGTPGGDPAYRNVVRPAVVAGTGS